MHVIQTILLLLIAAGVAYIAYRLFHDRSDGSSSAAVRREQSSDTGAGYGGPDPYGRQLAVYREVVRVLTRIAQDGHIEKRELVEFRSKTHEAVFLFDRELAAYIDEIYQRSMKLVGTNQALQNVNLSIGDERDALTVENSKQLIWLADQLSLLSKRFGKHLANTDPASS
jgi:hypothetical protein